jgi:competence ComEA-like helix-hairpin-helix protein
MLELNTADTSDLQQLHGIGPVFSKRIVKYRNLLGGYCSKEQLMEVYGLEQELYDKLKHHIVVDTSKVSKLNINTADIDDLKRHPYLDYYQAKAVVEYRQKIGAFKTINDLRHIVLIDNNTFEKIKPYLSVQ